MSRYHDDWNLYQDGEDEGLHWQIANRIDGDAERPSPAEIAYDEKLYAEWYEGWRIANTSKPD